MTNRKKARKDTRSAVTLHLPAAHADFVTNLLAKELDGVRRERQADQEAYILELLQLFRNAIELGERQRSLRGIADGKRPQKKRAETGGQAAPGGRIKNE